MVEKGFVEGAPTHQHQRTRQDTSTTLKGDVNIGNERRSCGNLPVYRGGVYVNLNQTEFAVENQRTLWNTDRYEKKSGPRVKRLRLMSHHTV